MDAESVVKIGQQITEAVSTVMNKKNYDVVMLRIQSIHNMAERGIEDLKRMERTVIQRALAIEEDVNGNVL